MDSKCFDVCVIGAGLYRSAATYHLSLNHRITVCLVGESEPRNLKDHRTRQIPSSHYDEARIVRQCLSNEIAVEMTRRSCEGFRQLEKQTGSSFINECGVVYFGPTGNKDVMACKEISEKMGFNPLLLDREQLRRKFPYIDIGENNQCTFLINNSVQINPIRLVHAMKSLAILQGCVMFNGIAEHIFEQYKQSDDRIIRVGLDNGQFIHTRKVLLCTGAFTHLKNLLPPHLPLDLRITPLQTLRVELTSEDIHRLYHMPAMSSLGEERSKYDSYLCAPVVYPDGKTYLKIGHGGTESVETLDEINRWYKSDGKPQMSEWLMALVKKLFPGLRPLSTETDTCVECHSRNGLPYIDMVTTNIGVAVGGNGVGARVCYETGRMAAAMIARGCWDHDLPAEHFQAQYKTQNRSSKL